MVGSSRRPGPADPPTPRQVALGRAATALLGAEALTLGAFATYYVYGLVTGQGSDPLVVIMSIVTLVVFTVGRVAAPAGVWAAAAWAARPNSAPKISFIVI